jgi:acid stress chaperone HdeB
MTNPGASRSVAIQDGRAKAMNCGRCVVYSVSGSNGAGCCLKSGLHWQAYCELRSEQGTTMRPWLVMFGTLALIGLQPVQAQVTIDITKITCNQFLGSQITDSRTLGIWLNGLREWRAWQEAHRPPSPGHISLVNYCEKHMDSLVLDAARNVFGADK